MACNCALAWVCWDVNPKSLNEGGLPGLVCAGWFCCAACASSSLGSGAEGRSSLTSETGGAMDDSVGGATGTVCAVERNGADKTQQQRANFPMTMFSPFVSSKSA
jgi:hypothetical protein